MYYVYCLYSKSFDKIYIGSTSDLDGRFAAHNHPKNKGWTKSFQPWELIYHESFKTNGEAITRKNYFKSGKFVNLSEI
jgi:putative endonuclease